MKYFVLLLNLFCFSTTWASFTKGNGGNAIYCESKSPQWQILDSFEAEAVLNFKRDSLITAENFNQMILSRLQKIDTNFAQVFQQNVEKFSAQARWVSQTNLGPVNDSFHLVLPTGCTLQQAAVQTNSVYVFQNDIWEQLSATEQDILITHEIAYRSLLKFANLEDSRPVRALVGLLTSENFSRMNEEDLQKFVSQHQILLR